MHDPFAPHLWPNVTHRPPAPDFSDPGFRVERVSFNAGPPSIGGCATCGTNTVAPLPPYRLTAPPENERLKIEIHTLRFGNPDWMSECAPTLDAWCARHDMPLFITSQWDASYPHGKFAFIDMIRSFLKGDNEWMMFFDADVIFHPEAPRPFFNDKGFHVRLDQPFCKNPKVKAGWTRWCDTHFSAPPEDWVYRNTGVWACDRDSAKQFLAEVSPPYIDGTLEQNQMNWWLIQANKKGMAVPELPTEWNRTIDNMSPAWAFHIYGKQKMKLLQRFRERGLLPDQVKRHVCTIPIRDYGHGAVVWPYLSTAAEWDELRYSKRSVEKFWSEKDWVHLLIGDKKPDWWNGEFIKASRYEDALWLGVNSAERVLWCNDDVFMLAPQSPETLRHARELGDMTPHLGETLVAQNTWRRGLGQVLMRLHHHGKPVRNFSSHTPYLYSRDKALEIFQEFGNFHKIPFETAYHNWHRTPWKACTEKAKGPHDLAGKLWVNPSMKQVTEKFIADLEILLAD